MAQVIAARAPYYNEQYYDAFEWYCIMTYSKPNTASSSLSVIKRSPAAGIPRDLRLNVSPLAKDYFRHTPNLSTPTGIVRPDLLEPISVELRQGSFSGTIYATFEAWDGWVEYTDNTLGVSNENVVKKLFRNSPQYISAKLFGTDNVLWMLSDGTNHSVTNTFEGQQKDQIFPVIHPSLTVTNAHTGISVIGRDNTNAELWRLEYEFECPFEHESTIGFVNKYGVWEFIDLSGKKSRKLNVERERYTRYSDSVRQNYNVNGDYEMEFNTGWVNDGFEDIIEGLMLSEAVVLYPGDGSEPTPLVIDTKSMDIQDSRTDKMVNYNFKAKCCKPIIPIV